MTIRHPYNKHDRNSIKKSKLLKQWRKCKGYYPCAAVPVSRTGKYKFNSEEDEIADAIYFKRCYRGSNYTYLKKSGNKRIRRTTNGLYQRSSYKKVYDLWWEYI